MLRKLDSKMVNDNRQLDAEAARWGEAAGTAASLLDSLEITCCRASAATLILISAQLGDLLSILRSELGLVQSEPPAVIDRGELHIDQPKVYSPGAKSRSDPESSEVYNGYNV